MVFLFHQSNIDCCHIDFAGSSEFIECLVRNKEAVGRTIEKKTLDEREVCLY